MKHAASPLSHELREDPATPCTASVRAYLEGFTDRPLRRLLAVEQRRSRPQLRQGNHRPGVDLPTVAVACPRGRHRKRHSKKLHFIFIHKPPSFSTLPPPPSRASLSVLQRFTAPPLLLLLRGVLGRNTRAEGQKGPDELRPGYHGPLRRLPLLPVAVFFFVGARCGSAPRCLDAGGFTPGNALLVFVAAAAEAGFAVAAEAAAAVDFSQGARSRPDFLSGGVSFGPVWESQRGGEDRVVS